MVLLEFAFYTSLFQTLKTTTVKRAYMHQKIRHRSISACCIKAAFKIKLLQVI